MLNQITIHKKHMHLTKKQCFFILNVTKLILSLQNFLNGTLFIVFNFLSPKFYTFQTNATVIFVYDFKLTNFNCNNLKKVLHGFNFVVYQNKNTEKNSI